MKYDESNKNTLNTTERIRPFHREAGGFLTVTRRNVESILPEFPDFLKKEIIILAEEKDDLEEDEDEEVIIEEGKVTQEILIYIENDPSKLDETNTLWEIQNITSLTGGILTTNQKYLIRHIGTGLYLSSPDHIELSLTSSGNTPENEFSFQNSSLHVFSQTPIFPNSLILIQNTDQKYICFLNRTQVRFSCYLYLTFIS